MNFGLITTSIGIILIILITYYLLSWLFFNDYAIMLHSSIKNARDEYIVPAEDIGQVNQGENYSYTWWMYIDDYNYRLGERRDIISRAGNPYIYLAPSENSIVVDVQQMDAGSRECVLRNIDLQRWVHVGVVVSTKYLDVYYNGRLARSCVLSSPIAAQSNAPVVINGNMTDDGVSNTSGNKGFGGKMARVQYYTRALSASDIQKIYRKGPASVMMLNMLFGIDEINIKYRNASGNSDVLSFGF
jgi:hypothetical protein